MPFFPAAQPPEALRTENWTGGGDGERESVGEGETDGEGVLTGEGEGFGEVARGQVPLLSWCLVESWGKGELGLGVV